MEPHKRCSSRDKKVLTGFLAANGILLILYLLGLASDEVYPLLHCSFNPILCWVSGIVALLVLLAGYFATFITLSSIIITVAASFLWSYREFTEYERRHMKTLLIAAAIIVFLLEFIVPILMTHLASHIFDHIECKEYLYCWFGGLPHCLFFGGSAAAISVLINLIIVLSCRKYQESEEQPTTGQELLVADKVLIQPA